MLQANISDNNHQLEEPKPDFFINYLQQKIAEVESLSSQKNLSSQDESQTLNSNHSLEQEAYQDPFDGKQFYEKCQKIYLQAQRLQNIQDIPQTDMESRNNNSNNKTKKMDLISQISHFVFFCKYFSDPAKRNFFKSSFEILKTSIGLESCPDFDIFLEFYEKAFGFTENIPTTEKQLANSTYELEHYLSGSQNIALHQKSYHYLLHTVEKIINSAYFGLGRQTKNSVKISPEAVVGAESEENLEKRERRMSVRSPAFQPTREALPKEFHLDGDHHEHVQFHLVKTETVMIPKKKKNKSKAKVSGKEDVDPAEKNKPQQAPAKETNRRKSEASELSRTKSEIKVPKEKFNKRKSSGDVLLNRKLDFGNKRYVQGNKIYLEKEKHECETGYEVSKYVVKGIESM